MTSSTRRRRSMLWPTIWFTVRRAWKVRWSPIILAGAAVVSGAAAFVGFDRRATHIVQAAKAADAADHPWRYIRHAAQASADAWASGVRSLALLLACVALLGLAFLASRDR